MFNDRFDVCNIHLQSVFSDASLNISALVSEVCHPVSSPAIDLSRLPHTKGLSFSDRYSSSQDKPIDILIGFDFLYGLLTDSVRRGARGLPVAINTKFGWTLHGPYSSQFLCGSKDSSLANHAEVRVHDPLNACINRPSNVALSCVPSSRPLPVRADGHFKTLLPRRS